MPAPPVLFDALIDYAGLFPPAKLSMTDAVRNHAAYLRGPHAARLGRFVVPVSRLAEFAAAYALLPVAEQAGWNLSVLAGNDPGADSAAIAAHHLQHPAARIVSIETKAATPAEVAQACTGFPAGLDVWVEVPCAGDVAPFLAAIKAASPHRAQPVRWASVSIPTPVADVPLDGLGVLSLSNGEIGDHPLASFRLGAKLRTGGVVADAFPPAGQVARFLAACHETGVVCKATAGLHHPLRSDYRLTYEPGSPHGVMFGFLNVFLAATLLHAGGPVTDAESLLTESSAESFQASPDAIRWRTHSFSSAQIAAARQSLCRSFGSCSFTEPISGLQTLCWL